MRTRQCFILFFLISFFLFAKTTRAERPGEGFYEGPYITIHGGIMQFDWDVNQRTLLKLGNDWIPVFHLGFGWNLNDWLAPEFQVRFISVSNGGGREHITGGDFGPALTLLWDPLLDFQSLRILPFIRPAVAFQIAFLPPDPLATDTHVLTVGVGGSISTGVRFLYNEYLYFGFEMKENFLHHDSVTEPIASIPTLIYGNGWKKQLEALTMIGVHF